MALADFSGVIPPEQSTTILKEAVRASAALTLGTRYPMGTAVSNMPVPKTFPAASWVTSASGRKPYTDIGLKTATLTAEEVAAVIGIPDKMIEDSSINLWAYTRPLVAEAIARALDDAVLFGIGAPASFPAGGVIGRAIAVNAGTDALDTVNKCMAQVEGQSLDVTGHAASRTTRQLFRGLRATTGELVLGTTQVDDYQMQSVYGSPISFVPWHYTTGANPATFITGNWKYLVIGVRSDIRFEINPSGVIADSAGVVLVSGFQDNVTPAKIWARFGCALIDPVTPDVPAGAKAFAKAALGATSGTAPTAFEPDAEEAEAPVRSARK